MDGRLWTGGAAEVSAAGEHGWHSAALGEKSPAPVIRVAVRSGLPLKLGAVLDLSAAPERWVLGITGSGPETVMSLAGRREIWVRFTADDAMVGR